MGSSINNVTSFFWLSDPSLSPLHIFFTKWKIFHLFRIDLNAVAKTFHMQKQNVNKNLLELSKSDSLQNLCLLKLMFAVELLMERRCTWNYSINMWFMPGSLHIFVSSFIVKTTRIPKIGCKIFISMCSVFACLALLSKKSK